MVPLANAFSTTFWSAASAFSISAHCPRGIFQNEMYEYIGGFSLTSDICAHAGRAQIAIIASPHTSAKAIFNLAIIAFPPSSQDLLLSRASAVYTLAEKRGKDTSKLGTNEVPGRSYRKLASCAETWPCSICAALATSRLGGTCLKSLRTYFCLTAMVLKKSALP